MEPKALKAAWKALADPTRRRILDLLREGPRTTGNLCERFRVSRFAVMKHLGVLQTAGLITVRRSGRERWNYLNAVPIREIYERWVRPYERCWAESLLRLRDHVMSEESEADMAKSATTTADFGVARIEMEIPINAGRQRVWKALIEETSRWWPRGFYAGAAAKSFHIEPKLGGRMYEDWGDGAGLIWATVIGLNPQESLHLLGHLVPPFGGPAITMLRLALREEGQTTVLELSDTVSGALGAEQEKCTREGWSALMDDGLRAYVEGEAA